MGTIVRCSSLLFYSSILGWRVCLRFLAEGGSVCRRKSWPMEIFDVIRFHSVWYLQEIEEEMTANVDAAEFMHLREWQKLTGKLWISIPYKVADRWGRYEVSTLDLFQSYIVRHAYFTVIRSHFMSFLLAAGYEILSTCKSIKLFSIRPLLLSQSNSVRQHDVWAAGRSTYVYNKVGVCYYLCQRFAVSC